ncbi:MAG: ribosome-associated heat shock protein Hsp15 [Gammaproteobacteria bacterium]|nr:ribosome-associated heat shock protein Hsp15 [Gammaproteobacteria bacterium]MCF6261320.1 ribosome-associated heat shock protein Hsp15 [Gammaproteobacteria bacterium]
MAHKSTPDSKANGGKKIRIDKWLWAARFYKTRSLASEAIKGGKVSVNSHRAKPSREVELGDTLVLRQGFDEKTVIVQALSDKRGPATVAQQLYQETADSIQKREKEKELRKLAAVQRPHGEGRPTKRSRRQIHRFTRSES